MLRLLLLPLLLLCQEMYLITAPHSRSNLIVFPSTAKQVRVRTGVAQHFWTQKSFRFILGLVRFTLVYFVLAYLSSESCIPRTMDRQQQKKKNINGVGYRVAAQLKIRLTIWTGKP